MDGKLAVLFALLSASDAALTEDKTYWTVKQQQPYLVASVGQTWVSKYKNTREIGIDYLQPKKLGAWQPTVSFNISKKAGTWLGYGATLQKSISIGDSAIFASSFFMPGVYVQGNDKKLGFPIEFKSGAEIGATFANKSKLSVYFSHRSNADFGDINPGMNAWHMRYHIPH